MPIVATQAIMPSEDVTLEYAEAMNEAIDAAVHAESGRNDQRAELARLREALGMVSCVENLAKLSLAPSPIVHSSSRHGDV